MQYIVIKKETLSTSQHIYISISEIKAIEYEEIEDYLKVYYLDKCVEGYFRKGYAEFLETFYFIEKNKYAYFRLYSDRESQDDDDQKEYSNFGEFIGSKERE